MIELGDRPLRVIDIPGHTPGSIAILDERYSVLISGDSVEDGNVFMFGIYRKEAKGQKVNLFGNDVVLYRFPYAGFLYED